jgi:hypothetical protein
MQYKPILVVALLVIGFLACGFYSFRYWDRAITDDYGFRQTQTALSTDYLIRDGITLDYQTPALGKPWAIPFEFPIYQILVALLVKLTAWPLDQTGRAVSLFFWIASIAPIYLLLAHLRVERLWRWATLLLIWSTPTYLFWSRTFLIESTALFFSLAFLAATLRGLHRRSRAWLATALLCGICAGLQKPTTFLIALVPTIGFAVLELRSQKRHPHSRPITSKLLLALGGLILIPLVCIDLWTRHADDTKKLNPVAESFLISSSLYQKRWIYGPLEQRLVPNTWDVFIYRESFTGVGRGFQTGLFLVIVLTAAAIRFRPDVRLPILILLAAYFSGPLIFCNLFYVHSYYYYENQVYLLLAFSLALYALCESLVPPWRVFLRYGFLMAMVAAGLLHFRANFLPLIVGQPTSKAFREELSPLSHAGNPKDILLVYGWDWNSFIPYYSGRKALMIPDHIKSNDAVIAKALEQLRPDTAIAALVVHGPLADDKDFIAAQVRAFDLNATPVRTGWGDFYLKRTKPPFGEVHRDGYNVWK